MKQDLSIYERRESEARSYCRGMPASFVKAQGSTMTDSEGNDYVDFLAGCSSLNYGHSDPDMKSALIDYITNDGVAHGLDLHTGAKAEFLETFERLILEPRGMDHKVMMTGPTGTNAVEAALKLARKTTGRREIVTFTNGFHGMTLGALACTANAGKRAGAGGAPLCGVTRMPFEGALKDVDSLAMIEAMYANPSSGYDAPAAFLIEAVQGEGGLNAASPEFLKGLSEIAKKLGALLIVDDIQAGCGRTGTFFSFDGMGFTPDLIPMAKSLSGYGLPFAALLIRKDLDVWKPAEHNGTFRGNGHAFVTAKVALEKFWADDAFAEEVAGKAAHLEARLTEIAKRVPGARLKGRGFMRGIDVGSGALAEAICARAYENGLIIETSGAHDEVVKCLAALTIPTELLDKGLDILDRAAEAEAEPARLAAE